MSNERKYVVLVADDEPSTVALLGRHLRARGYTVLEANDGDQAWELAHEHLPHLVILDVMMPGMSGWEVCRKIREAVSLAHTGVIMLTGIGEALNEMTSPLYGADAHVDKPFEFADLDRKIAETLERRQAGALGRPDSAATDEIRLELRPRDDEDDDEADEADEADDDEAPIKLPLPRTVGKKKGPEATSATLEAAKPLAKAPARPSAKPVKQAPAEKVRPVAKAKALAPKAKPEAKAKAPAPKAKAKAPAPKAKAKAPAPKAKAKAPAPKAKAKAPASKAKTKAPAPKAPASKANTKAKAPAASKKAATKAKAPEKARAQAKPAAKAKVASKAKPAAKAKGKPAAPAKAAKPAPQAKPAAKKPAAGKRRG